jgi:hypothetical protein
MQEIYEGNQPRVEKGVEAQNAVITHLEHEFGNDFELISQAGRSSKAPDIVSKIHGVPTQIEVKGRTNPNSTVKIYEKSIKRGQRDRVLDAFARAHSNGTAKTFEDYVDLLRKENRAVGFPGDPGVTAKAGKFYVPATDPKTRSLMRKYIMDTLKNNDDDYFAIHTFNTGETDMFDTGSTNHEVQAGKLPNIRVVRAETYGSAYKGAMRIAIKVIFQR